ncbi:hypothetical protein VTN00DRAFT_5018 [Thermoascus crustaceus]|uniref:uncharacterized protein n=1 Tax=Thermoascus crustaceus TaxID=5088 RepID=UPI0037436835
MAAQYVTKTYTYKNVQGKALQLDVYTVDPRPSGPQPAVLYFHGGYLITGDRKHIPRWLVQATLKRRWTLISADYRVLPESTGLELVEDLGDAYTFVSRTLNVEIPGLVDTSRLVIAGSSGGGYCAVQGGTRFRDPVPKAILAIYPMGDPTSRIWTTKGGRDMNVSPAEAAEIRAEIDQILRSKEISFGQTFPPDGDLENKHPRWRLVRYIVQEGLYVDYLTAVKGLGTAIATRGKTAIPEHVRSLFPTDFTVTKDLPPLIVTHGTVDRSVPVQDGEALVQKCREVGLPVAYFRVEGRDHDFDLPYNSVEDDDETDDVGKKALQGCLKELDKLIPSEAK